METLEIYPEESDSSSYQLDCTQHNGVYKKSYEQFLIKKEKYKKELNNKVGDKK